MSRGIPASAPSLVGPMLRRLRETKSIGLRELARDCGIHRNKLSRIERGEQAADQRTLLTLVAALGYSMVTFWLEIERCGRASAEYRR